jgi:mRNA interferase MazF
LAPIDPPLLGRGNVWLVRLDPVEGHEQGKQRPAVIVSASAYNTPGRALIAVAPITSQLRPHRLRVLVLPPQGGLTAPSDIQCDQIRTIALTRFITHLGVLSPAVMRLVDLRMRIYLDL